MKKCVKCTICLVLHNKLRGLMPRSVKNDQTTWTTLKMCTQERPQALQSPLSWGLLFHFCSPQPDTSLRCEVPGSGLVNRGINVCNISETPCRKSVCSVRLMRRIDCRRGQSCLRRWLGSIVYVRASSKPTHGAH